MSNLKQIFVILEERAIPLDAAQAESVRKILLELDLSCLEGSEVHARPALYTFEANDKSVMITEERGNHPRRVRILAGAVPERRLGIDSDGRFHQLP